MELSVDQIETMAEHLVAGFLEDYEVKRPEPKVIPPLKMDKLAVSPDEMDRKLRSVMGHRPQTARTEKPRDNKDLVISGYEPLV